MVFKFSINKTCDGDRRMKNRLPTWMLVLSFIISTFLGGNNAIAVSFSNAELPPFWGGALRMFGASLILLATVLILGLKIPKGRSLIAAILFGVLQFGFSYVLIYWSLLDVPPGMFMVVLSLTPLLTFSFAIIFHQEKFQWQILIGGLLSLIGTVLVFYEGLVADVPLLSLLAIIFVAVFFALAMVLFKARSSSHPVTTNAIGMSVGGIILLISSFVFQEVRSFPKITSTWVALIYLIIFGSVITFGLSFYVLKHWKASITSYQMVLLPIVTIVFSSILIGEVINAMFVVGGFFVLFGVYIGAVAPKTIFMKIICFFKKNLKLSPCG